MSESSMTVSGKQMKIMFPDNSRTYMGVLISLKAISHVWHILYYHEYELNKNRQIKRAFYIGFNSAIRGLEDEGYGIDVRLHQELKCIVCGEPLKPENRGDHIIPRKVLKIHGCDENIFGRSNYLPLCRKHNSSKGTKDMWDWWFNTLHKNVWDMEPNVFIQILRAYYKFYKCLNLLHSSAPKDWWGWKVLRQARGILKYAQAKSGKDYPGIYLRIAEKFFQEHSVFSFFEGE